MTDKDQWGLQVAGKGPVSMHPNIEGAKLSALHHVENGQSVEWFKPDRVPLDVAALIGRMNGKNVFVIYRY